MQVYRTMHSWHWISAAICLGALLLFCLTGIPLNHAGAIGATPQVTRKSESVPENLRPLLAAGRQGAPLPDALGDWIEDQFDVDVDRAESGWSAEELYVSAPGPGRDAWVAIDRSSDRATAEVTDRGSIAFL